MLAGGGYSSEALGFALGLLPRLGKRFALKQFAEQQDPNFVEGLPEAVYDAIDPAYERGETRKMQSGIVVCHATPDAWVPSKFPGWDSIAPCPPRGARYTIGRTMYETDSLPADWVTRCNAMDEVWVPTAFARDAFAAAGVAASKLVVLGEPIDTAFFDPALYKPLPLKINSRPRQSITPLSHPFRFLSVFKWEARKGWDVLLRAYFEEFTADEPVSLHVKTRAFHSDDDFDAKIDAFAAERGLPPRAQRPEVHVIGHELALRGLPRLYKAVDAFVLPSRGEGWGRPHVEAMAMGLPVIATNWSGTTAFLDDEVGYPLPYELVPVPAEHNLAGHRWAEPDVGALRRLMRRLVDHLDEAKAKGTAARERMAARFSNDALAAAAESEFARVADVLARRKEERKEEL